MWWGVCLALLFAVPAFAGGDAAWTRCAGDPHASAQQLVAACTEVIEAKAPDTLLKAYLSRAGAYEQLGDAAPALADYDRAVALDKNSAATLVLRGQFHGVRGETDAAIADFDAAIAINPANAQAWYGRGVTFKRKGATDRALADFSKAIEIDPEYTTALALRASTHFDRAEYDAAIADFTRALRQFPDAPGLLNDRGLAFIDKGDFARALADFDRAIALDPKMAKAFSNRGIVFSVTGKRERAMADYARAIALAPDYPESYANRARLQASAQQWDLALTDSDKAIALDPKRGGFYLERCQIQASKGDHAKALLDCDQAVLLEPGNVEFHYRRGLIRSFALNLKGAMAEYDEALQLKPDYISALMMRSRLYLRSRKTLRELEKFEWPAEVKDEVRTVIETIAPFVPSAADENRARDDILLAVRRNPVVLRSFNLCDLEVETASSLGDATTECRALLPDGMDERLVLTFTAFALLNTKHDDFAVTLFSTLLVADARDAVVLAGRGLAQQANGDAKAGAADFEAARRIDPGRIAALAAADGAFPSGSSPLTAP
jgi:tetratricopeptide (TPR) repeat protein